MKTAAALSLTLLTVAAFVAMAITAWWFLLRQPPLPEGLIQASGRIEGDDYIVASQAAQTGISVLRKDVPLTVQTAEAALANARSQLATARANEEQATRDAERFGKLAESGTVDRHRHEQMELASQAPRNQAIAAQQGVTAAGKQLDQARRGPERIRAKESEGAALAAQRDQAAALAEAQSVLDDQSIRAPASGIITSRMVAAGKVLAAGTPTFDIVDLDRLYLKVYGRRTKSANCVWVYHAASTPMPSPISALPPPRATSPRAPNSPPKEVQTPDERVKLVYAVRLYLVGFAARAHAARDRGLQFRRVAVPATVRLSVL